MAWRKNAVESAIASVRMENLEPSTSLLADLQDWADGNISLDEVRSRMCARFKDEDQNVP
jgi:hypothetical protein